jgi:hypothetical protein
MHVKHFSARVVSFKLAAALEQYEMDLRALADAWLEPHLLHRLQQDFGELRILGASVPRLSVAWVAVLVSRTRLLQATWTRGGMAVAMAALHEHLAAVEGLRRRCLRILGAQGAALA